jgi:hypothetical protein
LLPPLELAEKRRSTERISRTSKKAELRDLRLELQQFSAKLVKLNRPRQDEPSQWCSQAMIECEEQVRAERTNED